MPMIMIMRVILVVGMGFFVTRADAFDVMVMAFLRQTLVSFEADNLFPVFAHQAVHIVVTTHNTAHALLKGINDAIVVIKVARFNKLDVWKLGRDLINN